MACQDESCMHWCDSFDNNCGQFNCVKETSSTSHGQTKEIKSLEKRIEKLESQLADKGEGS